MAPTTQLPVIDGPFLEDESEEDEDEDEEEEEREMEENEEENMIRGDNELEEGSGSAESKLIRNEGKAATITGGARWKKIPITKTTSTDPTSRPLPTDNPNQSLYPSTLLLDVLKSRAPEDRRVKALGRILRGPLADYYKNMNDNKESSTTSPSVTIVRLPRNAIDKKRKRRNKWKKKGKRGKNEGLKLGIE